MCLPCARRVKVAMQNKQVKKTVYSKSTLLLVTCLLFTPLTSCTKQGYKTYDKTYNYKNPMFLFSEYKNIAVIEPENFTDKPQVKSFFYAKLQNKLIALGYKLVPEDDIVKLSERLGVSTVELFHPPYARLASKELGVTAVSYSSLIDYQCNRLKKDEYHCTISLSATINELKESTGIWSGGMAFSGISKNPEKTLESKVNSVLEGIPKPNRPAPRHPLEVERFE